LGTSQQLEVTPLNFVDLIQGLLPLVSQVVPGSAQATMLATAAINIIKLIQSQSNMTTDEILQRAGTTLDENEKMLIADLARLQGGGT
jgi:hypothetical protein